MYPRMKINLDKITHNTKVLVDVFNEHNISVMGVSKVFCAIPEVVNSMELGGIKYIADSRIQNLKVRRNR